MRLYIYLKMHNIWYIITFFIHTGRYMYAHVDIFWYLCVLYHTMTNAST